MDDYLVSSIKDAFKRIEEHKVAISEVFYNRFNSNPYDARIKSTDFRKLQHEINAIDNYLNDLFAFSGSLEFLHASIEANLPITYLEDLRGYSKWVNATLNNWNNLRQKSGVH